MKLKLDIMSEPLAATRPIFLLVPQVELLKRLDIDRDVATLRRLQCVNLDHVTSGP